MNREKFAWLASGAVLCYLALSVPGSLAQRDEDYRFVRTLVDIYRQVGVNYVEDVQDEKLQQAAISGMLASLDPHTMYVPPDQEDAFNNALDGNFRGVGIRLDYIEETQEIVVVTPIDNSPAWKAGVLPGDVLLKVDDLSVAGMRLEDVIPKIQGAAGTKVVLNMRRTTGEVTDITLTREEFVVPQIKGFSRNGDNSWNYWVDGESKIGYVRLAQFTPDIGAKIEEVTRMLEGQGMKGMILDLRFNPGGRLEEAEAIIDLFVKEGVIVSVKGRNRPEQKRMAKAEGTISDFPMVVLVNEHSASASEVVAGALKDNKRATVVGARTYGKGSVQEVMPLDANAGELKMTVAYWYLPSGKRVQRIKDAKEWGVEPDYVVAMDENAQTQLMREQLKSEQMRVTATVPVTNPASMPTSGPATTQATTQATDLQLEKAIEVVRDLIAAK